MILTVNWAYKDETVAELYTLDVASEHAPSASGVYIIKGFGRVTRGGQTIDLSRRLKQHEADSSFTNLVEVTWAEVPPDHLDGVEAYLLDRYRPDDQKPDVERIEVNLPILWAS